MTGPVDAPVDLTAAEPAAPLSPLEELRAEFQATPVAAKLFKRLPARSGRLVAEYRVVDKELVAAVLAKGGDAEDQDLLITALHAIHMRDPKHKLADDRGLVEFGAWAGQDFGGPLRCDDRLTDALGWPRSTARECLLGLFEGNTMALGGQAAEVGVWMTNTHNEALQDFATGS